MAFVTNRAWLRTARNACQTQHGARRKTWALRKDGQRAPRNAHESHAGEIALHTARVASCMAHGTP
eukprot:8693076-Lingulodinium_polyedra.AAC.1